MHRALAEAISLFEAGLNDCNQPEDRLLVEKYLAALAPVLADAVLGRDALAKFDVVERLFGHTWLRDAEPFANAFEKWRQFCGEYEGLALRGMTVHERLHALSLSEEYERAVARGEADSVRAILRRAKVDEESITKVVTSMRGST